MKSARLLFLSAVVALAMTAPAWSQTADPDLALLIPHLYGEHGLVVDSEAVLPDGSTHSAHFNSAFQSQFTQFNIALASQLAAVNLPSPASGYTYTFDPSLGVFRRSTQSFGPILSDRAETIGKGKFTFGLNYQRFTFDTIEGVDLDSVPAVFTHDDAQLGGGRTDVVTTVNSIDAAVGQFNAFFTYGITDHFDVSLALPVVEANLKVRSEATVQRIGTTNTAVHFFRDANGGQGNERSFQSSGSASGLGDIILRLKATAPKSGATSLALSGEVRFPTGDEMDLLGSGSWGFKPEVVASWALGKFSPHINLGYQWNGDSVLAGNAETNTKGTMPHQFLYAGGLDIGLSNKVTLAFDLLGQRVVDTPQLVETTFTAANGATFPQIAFERGSFNILDGAAGVKISAGGSLLIDINAVFKLNEAGLRDTITPFVGIEYGF